MVEPTAADMTIAVPGELHAHAQAAYDAYAKALKQAAEEPTAARVRALSAARSQLASAYRALADKFSASAVLFEALDHMAAQQFNDAIDDDRWAERLAASTFEGDVE